MRTYLLVATAFFALSLSNRRNARRRYVVR
jgi:hypothetical protein